MGYLRRPKTTQERRENGSRCQWLWIDDYKVKCRARRGQNTLVQHWDDIIRGDLNFYNWKRHRKSQYK